jgi:hypothetical protein
VQPNPYCRLGYVVSEAGRVFQALIGWVETFRPKA